MSDAIKASLHSYKSLATKKQLQITLEVPAEFSSQALKMLGVVDPAGSQWFALTRLTEQPVTPPAKANGPDSLTHNEAANPHAEPAKDQDRPRTPFRDMAPSQQAAIKCRDEMFRVWLVKDDGWARSCLDRAEDQGAEAAKILKHRLGIVSRKELDVPGPKQDAWSRMLTTYEYRDRA